MIYFKILSLQCQKPAFYDNSKSVDTVKEKESAAVFHISFRCSHNEAEGIKFRYSMGSNITTRLTMANFENMTHV